MEACAIVDEESLGKAVLGSPEKSLENPTIFVVEAANSGFGGLAVQNVAGFLRLSQESTI